MELKSNIQLLGENIDNGSNRTFMELKLSICSII